MGAAARKAIQIPAARKVLSLSAHPHLAEGFPENRDSLRFFIRNAYFMLLQKFLESAVSSGEDYGRQNMFMNRIFEKSLK